MITDEVRTSGAFLLHHFLGDHLRKRADPLAAAQQASVVVLVSMTQTLKHYDALAKKMGYPLAQNPRFRFINCFQHLGSFDGPFQHSNVSTLESNAINSDGGLPSHHLKALLETIIDIVEEGMRQNQGSTSTGCCLVFDDLSVLLDLGFAVEDLIKFVLSLQRYVQGTGGALVVLLHADKVTKPELPQVYMVQSLSHMVDYRLHVEKLESGNIEGVTGQIKVIINPAMRDDPTLIPVNMLYHISETGV
ncbi:hypothetical protein HDU76_007873, partial [Blyttiomyces sp. JEL0837]